MKRRTYLATAGVLTLGGCMGFGETDGDGGDDPDNASSSDDGTDDTGSDETGSDDTGSDDTSDEPTEDPLEAETFDDFESLSQWRVISGSASAYPDYSVTGSQSVLLEADEPESQVRMVRELEDPIDCTDLMPGLAIAAHSATNIGIQLYDEDRDKAVYRQRVHGMSIRHVNFGLEYFEGEPDLSAVTEIHISIWTGDGVAEAWIDDLTFVSSPETAVMLHFDGAYESHYEDALPLLEEYDYPATAFVPTARLREEASHEGSRLTYDQVEALADAGWTIGSYAAHGNALTSLEGGRTPESEIEGGYEWLEDQGYDGSAYLAYPSGSFNDDVIDAAADRHEVAFMSGYTGHGAVTNPTLCPRLVQPDASDVEHTLDMATGLGGVVTIAFGDVADHFDHVEAILSQIQALEEDGSISVITPADLAGEYIL